MYRRRAPVSDPSSSSSASKPNAPFKPVICRPSSSSSATDHHEPVKNLGSRPPPLSSQQGLKRHTPENQDTNSHDPLSSSPSLSLHTRAPGVPIKRLKSQSTVVPSAACRPVTNRVPTTSQTTTSPPPEKSANQYFEVVWRKVTTKKNKTWDGDGLLTLATDGAVTLEGSNGRVLARSRVQGKLCVDHFLKVGHLEVEISAVVSPQDKDTLFLDKTVFPLVKSKAPQTSFHSPLGHNTQSSLTRSGIIPRANQGNILSMRHDPNDPNAHVLPRPVTAPPSGKSVIDVVIDPLLGRYLRPHQVTGVQFLYECVMGYRNFQGRGALLADEMGLGKTLMTITLIWTLLKQTPIEGNLPIIQRALIVCPVTLINNWKKEFRKWLGPMRIGVFVVDSKANIRTFVGSRIYQVIIVGYERLRSISPYLQKASIDLIVCDEGHRLKSANNKSAQAILSLPTQRRIILSGTPIQNDLGEFFTMVDFLNPGILGTYATFKKEFEVPILKSRQPEALTKDIEKGRIRSEELSKLTRLFTLRRTADTLDKYLPPKTDAVIFCRPTVRQAELYKMLVESSSIKKCLGSNVAADHLRAITMLKKLCNSPALLKDSDFGALNLPPTLPFSSGKLQFLLQFLRVLYATTKEKVVIVSGYTQTLDVIEDALKEEHFTLLRLDGSTPTNKRQPLVDKFNSAINKDAFVFLLSSKSGGTGLNLVGASRLFLFDTDWNPSVDLQAMARVHRDGQKRPVYVYRLLTTGAMDEKIFQRQITKQSLAESFMNGRHEGEEIVNKNNSGPKTLRKSSAGISMGSSNTNSFSLAELQDLFTFHEHTKCHTHDLLGCSCQSKLTGDEVNTGNQPATRNLTYDEQMHISSQQANDAAEDSDSSACFLDGDEEKDDDTDDEKPKSNEKEIDRPSKRFGGWTTARDVVEGTAPIPEVLRERAKGKMKGLFEYRHIDVDAFLMRRQSRSGSSGSSSVVSFSSNAASQEDNGEEVVEEEDESIDDEIYIGDAVLAQVITAEKRGRMAYFWKKNLPIESTSIFSAGLSKMVKRKRKQNNKSKFHNPESDQFSQRSGKHLESHVVHSSSKIPPKFSTPPEDFPEDLYRFWHSRYRLFSRFDEGIKLSPEMWYSVTPETIARVISDQIKQRYPGANAVFDAFGGAAGNTIQLARDFTKVLYLDINDENVAMARNNYEIYWSNESQKVITATQEDPEEDEELKQACREAMNREEYIKNQHTEFYQGDFFTFKYPPPGVVTEGDNQKARFTRDDVIFLSPPWGGTSYSNTEVWDLASCLPYPVQEVVRRARQAFSDNIVLYLPRNSNLDEIINDKDLFPDLEQESDDESGDDGDKSVKKSRVDPTNDGEINGDGHSSSNEKGESAPEARSKSISRPRVPALYLNENGRCKALLLFLGPGLKPLRHDFYEP